MDKAKKPGKGFAIRCIAWALVVVAFAAFYFATSAAAAAQAANIQNAAQSSTRGIYLKDGTFTGQAKGYGGLTDVSVTVTNGYITDVTVTNNYDDSPYIENVIASLIPDLVANQTTTIDVVTNASYSSNGVRFAVRDALRSAGAMPDSEAEKIAALPVGASTETDPLSIGYLLNQQKQAQVASHTSGIAGGK